MSILTDRPLAKSSFWVTITNMSGENAASGTAASWDFKAGGYQPNYKKLYYETTWTNFSGINETHATGNYASGKGTRLYKVIGPRNIEDVQLATPYNPSQAEQIEKIWYTYRSDPMIINVQPQFPNAEQKLENVGRPYKMEGCQFKTFKAVDVDRESGEPGMIELTFTVDEWERVGVT